MNAPASCPVWSVGELLQWTTDFFSRHGVEEPRLSAELLLGHVLACSRLALYTRFERIPSPRQVAAFRELVQRRKERVPVAYLIGKAWFFSLELDVSPAVLIPRPETETLVEQAIRLVRNTTGWESPDILDMGTGSGCIAIALAKNLPGARVVAVDISSGALDIARKNAEMLGVGDRVRLLQGDLFAPVQSLSPPARFHLIVSNPPYIPADQVDALMPEVSRHEPRLALEAGPDGLAFYRRIAMSAAGLLRPTGALLVETAFDQAAAVEAMLLAAGPYDSNRIIRDDAGRERCVLVRLAAC